MLWVVVPVILGFVVTGSRLAAAQIRLSEYVQQHYRDVYDRETWTKELGPNTKFGVDFLSIPIVPDPELERLRTSVEKRRVEGGFVFAAMGVIMFVSFLLAWW